MKNFPLADLNKLMAHSFRRPEPKNVSFLLSRHNVRRVHEKFFSRRFEQADDCQTHFSLLSPKTFDSYLLDMMYIVFMKNFPLADLNKLMADSFRRPEPKNVSFLLSRHNVRRVHEKLSSRRLEQADGCQTHFGLLSPKKFDSYFLDMMYVEFMKIFISLVGTSQWPLDSFRPPEPKNVSFLLSRHDVRRVHEKFSSRLLEQASGRQTHFGLLSPQTFHSYFLDMMYVEFMKNCLLADSSDLMLLDSFRSPEPKNV